MESFATYAIWKPIILPIVGIIPKIKIVNIINC